MFSPIHFTSTQSTGQAARDKVAFALKHKPAALAMLATNVPPSVIARILGLNPRTISKWHSALKQSPSASGTSPSNAPSSSETENLGPQPTLVRRPKFRQSPKSGSSPTEGSST